MTPEAQRIAIAEACGWKPHADGRGYHQGEHSIWKSSKPLPDYLTDLNAMHEAEKYFKDDEAAWHGYKFWLLGNIEPHRHEIHATAAQRAEAFLRTLGKWGDDV
jgi:hypothetical protein